MSGMVVLERIELIPALELEPFTFATRARSSPTDSGLQAPEEWHRDWLDSLADSDLGGLKPLRQGSWHVPTTEFADPETLRKFLDVIVRGWGGIESLSDPDGDPVLNGGLALSGPSHDVLLEPGCCANLGDAANWRTASNHRESEWQMLWIGHPWLSVSYQAPWLIISDPHESHSPTARWAVCPDELQRAVVAAEAELERLARQIIPHLISQSYEGDPYSMGRKLVGLGR